MSHIATIVGGSGPTQTYGMLRDAFQHIWEDLIGDEHADESFHELTVDFAAMQFESELLGQDWSDAQEGVAEAFMAHFGAN